MIIRINFSNHESMFFGDSYKSWEAQAGEFLLKNKNLIPTIVSIDKSKSKWMSWGGLKWCPVSSFQLNLNREGCQSSDPDNSSPRIFSEMIFVKDSAKLQKKLDYYLK